MKHRAPERLVGQIEARAELVRLHVLEHLVESQPGIEGQLVGDLPLVLEVAAEQPAEFVAAIVNVERRLDRIAGRVERFHGRCAGDLGLLAARGKSGPQRVRVRHPISAVALQAVDERGAQHVGRHTVEQHVADDVGYEMDAGVTGEIRELRVNIAYRALPGHHPVGIFLILVFVEVARIVTADPVDGHPRKAAARLVDGRLSRIVGNLEALHRHPGDRAEPGRFIEQGRGVTEEPAQIGLVVNGVDQIVGVFETETVLRITAGREIFGLAGQAAIFEEVA